MAEILTSWKEIAAHFGKGVRTIQRWERELGLPVRRPNKHKIVIAFAVELDEWLRTRTSKRSRPHQYELIELRIKVQSLEQQNDALKKQLECLSETSKRKQLAPQSRRKAG